MGKTRSAPVGEGEYLQSLFSGSDTEGGDQMWRKENSTNALPERSLNRPSYAQMRVATRRCPKSTGTAGETHVSLAPPGSPPRSFPTRGFCTFPQRPGQKYALLWAVGACQAAKSLIASEDFHAMFDDQALVLSGSLKEVVHKRHNQKGARTASFRPKQWISFFASHRWPVPSFC